jgi:hypothetical protein
MTSSRYGLVGWQEFANNRKEILAKYDSAKSLTVSKPVKTEHGVIAEAAIREWLTKFLPGKYRVSSGYIIPDIVQTEDFKLYHYDVIIYDALNAPVLWTESNPDQSEQGRRRAIPAKYVHSVLEIKASFDVSPARDALNKLRQLNAIAPYLPSEFSCAIIFVELPLHLISQTKLLYQLIPEPPVYKYWGGLILRCEVNNEMSGEIILSQGEENTGSDSENLAIPLAKDIDELSIFINSDGQLVIEECGSSVKLVSNGARNWFVSKGYGPLLHRRNLCINLTWSANGFSQFGLNLLSHLEGKGLRENPYRFGQIFDHIDRRS